MSTSDVVSEFWDFFRERAESGVVLGAAVSEVCLEGGVLTVTFDAGSAGVEEGAMVSTSAFDNWAFFAGTPVAFTNEQGSRLRAEVEQVDTRLASGRSMGSAPVGEIFERGAGRPLEAGE